MNKVIKISLFGPKPYSMGGHDLTKDQAQIINKINKIITSLQSNDNVIVGLTSLSLGIDQVFAQLCLEKDIPYNVYAAHDNLEKLWTDLPETFGTQFQYLYDNANNIINVNAGPYSPKKVFQNQLKVLKDSDYVIYVSGFIPIKHETIQATLNNKQVFVIPYKIHV